MKLFRNPTLFFLLLSSIFIVSCQQKRSGKARVLVFGKTAGFHHESIPAGFSAVQKLGTENNFEVDTTTNADFFSEDSLKKYSAVVFLNTTGNILNTQQEIAFERFIQAGGGYVGVHSATDTEYDWGWYGRLVGAYFEGHPEIQDAVLRVTDATHISTKDLPKEWKRKDEWYNFKKLNKDVKVLLTIDEKSYTGGKLGDSHPMAWYHEYDGGRAFYTGLGHTNESYTEPAYLKHLLGGIQYAIGENKDLDYGNAKSQLMPEEDRFQKTILTQGTLDEPTEMAILPNMDVLIAQRRGDIMLYSDKLKTIKKVGFLNAYFNSGVPNVNAEEGVLGMTTDPDFKNNNYIYIFYSPVDTSVNRLSRFEFKNDSLITSSEKIVLQFYSQRQICCHTGGSLAFGKDNLLYISAGDNSTPFDEKGQVFVNRGYGPLNDAPGHEQYDARRSSGNTNDLRGKIMRIRIKPDGSYEIPEGNLFPDNAKARPEIFVMGNRNPYRISVDKKTGFLYWGEVGPDARVDSFDTRGPKGYDELNQARKAGFFGWPLMVGNNFPYYEYDYTTGKTGLLIDPAKPMNRSRNNTGLQELPPVQPAFIWYPYDASTEFPQVGTGGRNAMAGPVYYTEDFSKEKRLPDYYNGKLFMYDWIRGWIKAVTMLPNGDFDKMEPFMENTKFNSLIDMEVAPDGRIYLLEYGSGWFAKNADAGLSRVDYFAGNRPPKVGAVTIDKKSGTLPFQLSASVEATDPEKDVLTYKWTIGDQTIETKEPKLSHTISKPGEYNVRVEVMDDEKATNRSGTTEVYAGNNQPEVNIVIAGNKSFYFPGKPVEYKINVVDPGDSINLSNLFVSTDYIKGLDKAEQAMGHQVVSAAIAGKNLMLSSDCKSCHKVDEKSIGPAYKAVAQKYSGRTDAGSYLVSKILKGGAGVWGENAMPAHPTMKEADAGLIVQWVLSLDNKQASSKSLPSSGRVTPVAPDSKLSKNVFTIQATYTDNAGGGIRPLTNSGAVYLRNNTISVNDMGETSGFNRKDSAGTRYLSFPQNDGWIKISNVDLTGITRIELISIGLANLEAFDIEIRSNKPEGNKIAGVSLKDVKGNATVPLAVKTYGTVEDIYIVFKTSKASAKRPLLSAVRFMQ